MYTELKDETEISRIIPSGIQVTEILNPHNCTSPDVCTIALIHTAVLQREEMTMQNQICPELFLVPTLPVLFFFFLL